MYDNNQNWMNQQSGMQGIGGLFGGLYNMFGPQQKNPADAANKYLEQIPGASGQYLNPYINAGQGAMGKLTGEYGDLLKGNVYDRLAGGYKESPGYKHALESALGASGNAAAAGGTLGTPMHQEQNMNLAGDIASKDFNNYLQAQMGLYGQGLSGLGDINKMGFGASGHMADTTANTLGSQAQYGYAGQAGQNQARSNNMNQIFGSIGQMLPMLFGMPPMPGGF